MMKIIGDGTIVGLQPGGLPDGTVQQADLAQNVEAWGWISVGQALYAGPLSTYFQGFLARAA